MGYQVNKIRLHSIEDNKNYNVELPKNNLEMLEKFEKLIKNIREFNIENFEPKDKNKCEKCIYEPSCDRSLIC